MPQQNPASAWTPVSESAWQPVQEDTPQQVHSAPSTPLQKAFGANPVSDTLSTVGSHLKNLVAGPYHALADEPRNETEQNVVNQGGGGAFGRYVGLPLDRITGASASMDNFQKAKGLTGNDKVQAYEDAVPVVGPWAKQIESDVQNKGVVPGLAGLATDVMAPAGAGKIAGALRSGAPGIAEGALGISKLDRAYGKTPGRAILDETSGVRPATIERSAQARINELQPRVDQMARQHTAPVDITPAIDTVDETTNKAKARNNVQGVNALEPVKAQLTENPYGLNQPFASPSVGNPNAVLSPYQSAEGALNLKRGLRDQFVKNSWNPEAGPVLAKDAARGASGVIDKQLDRALGPEFERTNQRLSSLYPVQEGAESVSRNAGVAQRVAGRLKAHTGALTGAGMGAAAGSTFGPPGAIAGGIAGLAAPEIVGSPTAQMVIARTLNSKVPGRLAKAFSTGGVVTPRRSRDDSNE